jgi:PmbA protein
MELIDLTQEIVKRAVNRGATDAECLAREGEHFSVRVRLGEIERLTESGSKAIGLRVLNGQRSGSTYTSDFSEDGIETLVSSALEAARFTSEDTTAGLPDREELGAVDASDLGLYSPEILEPTAEEKIGLAKDAEQAALDADSRIVNSEGGSFGSGWSRWVIANSRGFAGEYRSGSCSLSVVPVAQQNGHKERDYWYTIARGPRGLESPAEVGRLAAERAIRRLNARKVETASVPVVFEPRTARSLLGHIFSAVNGDAVYRDSSFLAGKLGQKVAADQITVYDDGLLPGGFGTSPFDDEGVATRRTTVIQNGVLESYLLNCYTARKLGLKTTGNASRGLTGSPGVGHGNLSFEPGTLSGDEIIASVKNGFYVTELMGQGVNLVNGDYSRGAAGYWIENGELAYPVSEVTIAGNLKQMLFDLEAVGSDLDFRSSIIVPTVKIREMTVAGK